MRYNLSDSMFSELFEVIDKQIKRFTTSADVVMKASGLRIEAIRAIAREQGIEVEDTESRCIDENLLSLLADAHVRQLKSYFNKTKLHILELTGAELSMFVDFCETFKKRQTNNSALSWDNIDADAIREQFIKKVHTLTPNRECPFLFSDCILLEIITESPSLEPLDLDALPLERQKDNVISRLQNNRWLYIRCKEQHVIPSDSRSLVRRVTLSSRYHIFSDDEYELLYDTKNRESRSQRSRITLPYLEEWTRHFSTEFINQYQVG